MDLNADSPACLSRAFRISFQHCAVSQTVRRWPRTLAFAACCVYRQPCVLRANPCRTTQGLDCNTVTGSGRASETHRQYSISTKLCQGSTVRGQSAPVRRAALQRACSRRGKERGAVKAWFLCREGRNPRVQPFRSDGHSSHCRNQSVPEEIRRSLRNRAEPLRSCASNTAHAISRGSRQRPNLRRQPAAASAEPAWDPPSESYPAAAQAAPGFPLCTRAVLIEL